MADQTIAASTFKAHCLRILDEVERTGVPVTVTKRGRPVARLTPLSTIEPRSLRGSVTFNDDDDLLAPLDVDWDAERAR